MTTEQGNKLIAEFLGWEVEKISPTEIKAGKHTYKKGVYQSDEEFSCEWVWGLLCNPKNTGSFRFHTSWDWLMPCVKKFNDMVISGEIEHDMVSSAIHDALEVFILKADIENSCKHFAQLIHWYNTQKH